VRLPGSTLPKRIPLEDYKRLSKSLYKGPGRSPEVSSVFNPKDSFVMPKLRNDPTCTFAWERKNRPIKRRRVKLPHVPLPQRVEPAKGLFCQYGWYRSDWKLGVKFTSSLKSAMYKNCRLFEVSPKATHFIHILLHKLIGLISRRGMLYGDFRNILRIRILASRNVSHAMSLCKVILCKAVARNTWRLPLSVVRRPFYELGKSRKSYRKIRTRRLGPLGGYDLPEPGFVMSEAYYDNLEGSSYSLDEESL